MSPSIKGHKSNSMCGPKVKDWGKNKVEKQIELGSNLTTLIFPHRVSQMELWYRKEWNLELIEHIMFTGKSTRCDEN